MKYILVPVDFSVNSENAAIYGCLLAQKTGTPVTLYHAIEPVADNVRQPFSLHEKYREQTMSNRLNELAGLKCELEKKYPDISITYIAEHGTAALTISEFIKATRPKLVVMGTKGKNALEQIFTGSVAKGVVARSAVPVIVIPEKYVQSELDAIVVATNHFEKNTEYLMPVVELASLFNALIHVIVFIDTDEAKGSDYSEMVFKLDSYTRFLKKQFPDVRFKTELLEGSEFDTTIEKYDEAINADLFTLFTYPKTKWEKIINKSMAKKMVSASKIPMLVVPAGDQ